MAQRRSPMWPNGCNIVDTFLSCVAKIETPEALRALMHDIASELGFRHFALISHADLRISRAGMVDIREYPQAVADRIIDRGEFRRDPIMRACLFADSAFMWSDVAQIIAIDKRDRAILECGMRNGLSQGVTIPSFKLGHLLGSCTFAGQLPETHVRRILGIAQMIGVFAFQRARRLAGDLPVPAPSTRLNPRPRECVVLAGRGLSNKEIARALALAPRTVDGYLADARKLFSADDRTELVAAALLAGEIELHELR